MLLTLNVEQLSTYTSNTDNQTLIHNRPTQLSKTITQQYNVPALWLKYSYNPNLKLVSAECTHSLSLFLSVSLSLYLSLSVCLFCSLSLLLCLAFTHTPHHTTPHPTIHTHTRTHACTHAHMHTHTHIHAHTHTHTHHTINLYDSTSPEDEAEKMRGMWESLLSFISSN